MWADFCHVMSSTDCWINYIHIVISPRPPERRSYRECFLETVWKGTKNLGRAPPSSSKHLKGQLDPPVGNGHVFGSKQVSWILLLVNVPEMQKRSSRNTKMQKNSTNINININQHQFSFCHWRERLCSQLSWCFQPGPSPTGVISTSWTTTTSHLMRFCCFVCEM